MRTVMLLPLLLLLAAAALADEPPPLAPLPPPDLPTTSAPGATNAGTPAPEPPPASPSPPPVADEPPSGTDIMAEPAEPPTPPATQEASSGDETQSASTTAEFHPPSRDKIPAYQLAQPTWGVELTGTPAALGGDDITDGQNSSVPMGVSVHVEYQPKFIQSLGLGVLGFGPSLAVYPMDQSEGVTNSPFALWSAGVQVRYQARYFREQPVVPVVGFAYERLVYRLSILSDPNGQVNSTGPLFGIWILLNWIEPHQAAEFFADSGVSRSYLVAEIRNMSGEDPDVTFSGNSYYFGLRIEF